LNESIKMKKVCVTTGSRSDYGILSQVMKEIRKSKELELEIVAAGSHLEETFGYTYKEIERDGFIIDKKVRIPLAFSSNKEMASATGEAVRGFSEAFSEIKPDLVLVLGDRFEVFAAVIAAYYQLIPVAHIHGGDKSTGGSLDDSVRHAITKLSQIHFVASRKSFERVKKLGEEEHRIHLVGSPAVDMILSTKKISREELNKKFGLKNEPYTVVIQHPITSNVGEAGAQMRETMEAVKSIGLQAVVVYPNADAGGKKIIEEIEKYSKLPFVKVFKSVPFKDYVQLLMHSSCLVGNSSGALIETPSLHIPAVNIGPRQNEREKSENVIDAPHDRREIEAAIRKALFDKEFKKKVENCKNPYGIGKSSKKIVEILEKTEINEGLIRKKLAY